VVIKSDLRGAGAVGRSMLRIIAVTSYLELKNELMLTRDN
jgi:hypothetical protein